MPMHLRRVDQQKYLPRLGLPPRFWLAKAHSQKPNLDATGEVGYGSGGTEGGGRGGLEGEKENS